jgi:hypothetical protein
MHPLKRTLLLLLVLLVVLSGSAPLLNQERDLMGHAECAG